MTHTPGPWKWWTSCSWRRLRSEDRGVTRSVLEPYVCHDGCPDTLVSEEDMGLIAAAPDMLAELKRLHELFGHQATADVIKKAETPIAR